MTAEAVDSQRDLMGDVVSQRSRHGILSDQWFQISSKTDYWLPGYETRGPNSKIELEVNFGRTSIDRPDTRYPTWELVQRLLGEDVGF